MELLLSLYFFAHKTWGIMRPHYMKGTKMSHTVVAIVALLIGWLLHYFRTHKVMSKMQLYYENQSDKSNNCSTHKYQEGYETGYAIGLEERTYYQKEDDIIEP